MNVIIFGPPGGGKGTQSKKIANEFNLKQVSTGDLLRIKSKVQDDQSKEIDSFLKKGELVSDDIVDNIIKKFISNSNYSNKLIFDGYPRTLKQTYNLDRVLASFKQKISAVFNLKVEKDVILKRISGRITCSKCNKIFRV